MYEWDPAKARANHVKHGIGFADAVAVFEDANALTIDQVVDGEQRHVTLGMDGFGRVLLVSYTWRGDTIRIISARKATRSQVRQYEREL